MVPGEKQEAEGQDAVHRRPENGENGDDGQPETAGADGRGHPEDRGYLQRLRSGDTGGGQGILRGGRLAGDRKTGLYPYAGAVCGNQGAGGRWGTLRGEDGAADFRTGGVVPKVPRAGGGDQEAVGGDWV